MCCCVTKHGLMVRVGPEAYEDALSQPTRRVDGFHGPAHEGLGAG